MIRIGCVPYLNAKPLLEGLDDVLLLPPADLVGKLVSGSLDVALLPAIEVLRRGLAHVPGIAIASPGKTDSVRLHHAVPVADIRRVALDRNSRTSNMLTRILLEKRHGLRPTYVVRDPTKGLSFKAVDAVVTIGDTSFRPGRTPFLDLGSEWRAFTGRPFVYALWAYRPGHPKAREIAATLKAAKQRGTARIPEIARREAARLKLTPAYCRNYLTDSITFDLGAAERAGLRLFGKYADDCS
ncbi:MAG TPA: menaquinone biosynthesis protein [Planctomycetota bacterium]|jgi:chorismate dehydratase|nr:menaquinone biosynthesis protein [Planctomycetota bacterium]